MELSDATEKIPSDTTEDRSRGLNHYATTGPHMYKIIILIKYYEQISFWVSSVDRIYM
jgi:hypothetical protein